MQNRHIFLFSYLWAIVQPLPEMSKLTPCLPLSVFGEAPEGAAVSTGDTCGGKERDKK